MTRALCVGKYAAIGLWILLCVLIPIRLLGGRAAWDYKVYATAFQSLSAGHDPYLDGAAVQEQLRGSAAPGTPYKVSFTYVYPPITLPLMRVIGVLPHWSSAIYWLLYAAGVVVPIWVGIQAGEEGERPWLRVVAPIAVLYPAPALILRATILCGNIAYILYGFLFLTAWLGWRRRGWALFYVVVLLAGILKPPYLVLLAIPILSSYGQWWPAIVTGGAGLGLFFMQTWLWPERFANFMRVVQMQFTYNADFGASLSGVLGLVLYLTGRPFPLASTVFFLIYGAADFLLLFYLSRRYLRGEWSLQQWMPVMLCGVWILNPRWIEYDLAPLSMLLGLIALRAARPVRQHAGVLLAALLAWAGANLVISMLPSTLRYSGVRCYECFFVMTLFAVGVRQLLKGANKADAAGVA